MKNLFSKDATRAFGCLCFAFSCSLVLVFSRFSLLSFVFSLSTGPFSREVRRKGWGWCEGGIRSCCSASSALHLFSFAGCLPSLYDWAGWCHSTLCLSLMISFFVRPSRHVGTRRGGKVTKGKMIVCETR